MKKVIFKSVIILVVSTLCNLNVLFAKDFKSLYISQSDDPQKIELNLDKTISDQVVFKIFDLQVGQIFEDLVDTHKYKSKRYDLSALEYGSYEIVVLDQIKIEKIRFKFEKGGIIFNRNESQIIYKPSVLLNADKTLDMNFLALGSRVKVKIYSQNQIIYSHNTSGQPVVSKRFNLKKLSSGFYTMEIISQGEIFYKYITI